MENLEKMVKEMQDFLANFEHEYVEYEEDSSLAFYVNFTIGYNGDVSLTCDFEENKFIVDSSIADDNYYYASGQDRYDPEDEEYEELEEQKEKYLEDMNSKNNFNNFEKALDKAWDYCIDLNENEVSGDDECTYSEVLSKLLSIYEKYQDKK